MIPRELRTLFSSIGLHWKTKLLCHALVGAWIAFFYYAPQRWPLFPAQSAPTLPIDLLVPFQPAWALVYQSVFIVHTLALWLPRHTAAVKHYTFSIALAFACGAVVFWFWPTSGPPPEKTDSVLYIWLVANVTGLRNAIPSLHAGMSVIGVAALSWHLRDCKVWNGWLAGLMLWWTALLYSLLATRQHRILDVPPGILLGFLSVVVVSRFIHPKLNHHYEKPSAVSLPQPDALEPRTCARTTT